MLTGFYEALVTQRVAQKKKQLSSSLDYEVRGNDLCERGGELLATLEAQLDRGSHTINLFAKCENPIVAGYLANCGFQYVGKKEGKEVYRCSLGIPKSLEGGRQ